MAKNPNSKTAAAARSAAAKRGVATKKYNADAAAATTQREQYTESNPSRFEDVFDRTGVPHWRGQVSTQHLYTLMGYHGASDSPHPLGQMELPGMEQRPDAVPAPKRWEEYSPSEQDAVRKAAGRFGVTEESAHAALGAQIDHANVRENGHHASFYSAEGQSATGANLPRTQLKESAQRNNVDFGVQAMANAMTSPNNRFVARAASGEVRYPNDEAASFAIKWAQEGKSGLGYEKHPNFHVPAEDKVPGAGGKLVKRKDEGRKYPVQGYPSNMRKTIDAVHDINKGASVSEAWGMTERKSVGRSDYGDPKTAPFHNSWVDPHGSSQFWVSDTHSGPAAFAPHLHGRQETDYMGIDGIHAFHDHIARKVMAERGLTSLSGTQSQHWSEEKQRSGTAGDVMDMTPASSTEHAGMPTTGTATYGEYEKQADGSRKQVGKRAVEFEQGSMF